MRVAPVVNTEHSLPARAVDRVASETTTRQRRPVVLVWIAFISLILVFLALDLGVFHRKSHVVSVREALTWSSIWVVTALAFTVFVYVGYDNQWLGLGERPDPAERSAAFPEGRINSAWDAAVKFLTGYVVELSLSVDNVFVIAMLLGYFAVPRIYQHRVLFWGILGALVMRGTMIAIGAKLVSEFTWILYVFGVILILTAVKMLFSGGEHGDINSSFVMRTVLRWLPVTDRFYGQRFSVRADPATGVVLEAPAADADAQHISNTADRSSAGGRQSRGRLMLTPLALALVMVEATDLIFAVD